jgi:hypothetical protein
LLIFNGVPASGRFYYQSLHRFKDNDKPYLEFNSWRFFVENKSIISP